MAEKKATMRATDDRAYRCQCGGLVKAKRGQTLDEVRKIHAKDCSMGVRIVKDKK